MEGHIPHAVHVVWLQGKDAMPPAARYNLYSWRNFNPDMSLHVHDEAAILELLQEWPELLQRFLEAPNRPCKKDIAQFAIIYRYGGVFVDVDVQCLRSVSELLDANTLLAVEYIGDNGLGNKAVSAALCIVGAVPEHPIMKAAMDGMAATVYNPALQTPLRYISANAANWSRAVEKGFQAYTSTPLQFFIQPAHMFGLDNSSKYVSSILKGHPEAYTVLTGTSGSWHNGFQRSYHSCVAFAHDNANAIKFAVSVFMVIFVIFVIIALSFLLSTHCARS